MKMLVAIAALLAISPVHAEPPLNNMQFCSFDGLQSVCTYTPGVTLRYEHESGGEYVVEVEWQTRVVEYGRASFLLYDEFDNLLVNCHLNHPVNLRKRVGTTFEFKEDERQPRLRWVTVEKRMTCEITDFVAVGAPGWTDPDVNVVVNYSEYLDW